MEKLKLNIYQKNDQVFIGNSGLSITFMPSNKARLDFTPEGCCDRDENNREKYALIFLGAIAEFLTWLDEETVKPEFLINTTNACMAEFVVRNLKPAAIICDQRGMEPNILIDVKTLRENKICREKLRQAQEQLSLRHYEVDQPGSYCLPYGYLEEEI